MSRKPVDVPCRFCSAAAGTRCINKAIDNKTPLKFFDAHLVRIRDASVDTDDDELF